MAADEEVRVALDEDELAVGGGEAVARIVDLLHGVDAGEFGEDERHDSALPEAGDDLAGRVGEEDGVVFFGLVDRAGEIAGLVDGVGVGEE